MSCFPCIQANALSEKGETLAASVTTEINTLTKQIEDTIELQDTLNKTVQEQKAKAEAADTLTQAAAQVRMEKNDSMGLKLQY